jgi:hypothetical protein
MRHYLDARSPIQFLLFIEVLTGSLQLKLMRQHGPYPATGSHVRNMKTCQLHLYNQDWELLNSLVELSIIPLP